MKNLLYDRVIYRGREGMYARTRADGAMRILFDDFPEMTQTIYEHWEVVNITRLARLETELDLQPIE